MREPLVPYEQYEAFGKLDQLSEDEKYAKIKELLL